MILGTQQNWFHYFWIPILFYIDFTNFIPETKLAIALELKGQQPSKSAQRIRGPGAQ